MLWRGFVRLHLLTIEQDTYMAKAPGKLNLFLHVVGLRSDGYHLLQSACQLIDYHDTIYLKVRTDGQIEHENPLPHIPVKDDLIIRAATLLKTISGTKLGVSLCIDKCLPIGGGLGGGSSNAATVLLALNQLWKLDYSQETLQAIGLSLGADVPFFIFGQNAWVEGIGEVLQPISLPQRYFVVLTPKVHVATTEIFRDPHLTKNTKSIRMRDFAIAFTRNDLTPVACKKYPEILVHIDWLNQFAEAKMTGSGSCVFADFATQSEADAVIQQLPSNMTGFVTRALDQHPLFELT